MLVLALFEIYVVRFTGTKVMVLVFCGEVNRDQHNGVGFICVFCGEVYREQRDGVGFM